MDSSSDYFNGKFTIGLFVESLPCAVYWKNTNGVFIGCNSKYLDLVGLKSIYGKSNYDIPWYSHAEEEVHRDRIVLNSCQVNRFKNGNYMSIKSPILTSNDKIIGLMGILIDQTEQNEHINFLDQIIAALPGHVYWKNKECILLGCNNEQAKDAGLISRDEVIGKTAYDLVWQEQPQDEKIKQATDTDKLDKEVMLEDKTRIVEELVFTAEGKKYYLSKKSPLHNQEGQVIGLSGVSVEITELKSAQEKLKQQYKELQEKDYSKIKFIENFSHDINLPLNSMITNIYIFQALISKALPDEQLLVLADKIQEQSTVLTDLFRQMTQVFLSDKLSKNQFLTDFNIDDLIKSEIRIAKASISKNKNLTISYKIDKRLPKRLSGDFLRISQILRNILSNAIKYTEEGNIVCDAKLIKNSKDHIISRFIITDTGIGIAHSDRDHIFGAFERVKNSHQSNIHGLGMGLYVVKQHLEVLGGKIDFESALNQGTKFWVDIPLRKIID